MASETFSHLPIDPHSKAFAVIGELLADDPLFASVVKTFRRWTGDRRDVGRPSAGECPWVRLTARCDRAAWSSTTGRGGRYHEMPLMVEVETAVSGTDGEDQRLLWHAIQSALLPEDAPRALLAEQAYKDAGLSGPPTIHRPAIGAGDKDGKSDVFLMAEGLVEFPMFVRT